MWGWTLVLAAGLGACTPSHETHASEGPLALVVVTPGMEAAAFLPLALAFGDAGIETWTVWIPPGDPLPDPGAAQAASARIRAMAQAAGVGGRPVGLVAHGPGATLALLAAPGVADAVVALGPLLGPPGTLLAGWLAGLPVPDGSVDLSVPLDWRGHDAASLLLGQPEPRLGSLPAPLARDWQRWLLEGPPLDPAAVTCPVFVGAGARDRLAPVESIRSPASAFPDATFVRFGLLRFAPRDPGSLDLLDQRAVLRVSTRWLADTLSERAG
ncbi:MAG: hypothetical protein JXB39_01205 [Deltaproteobacteria bacterium]|nr:hypothetical protein [Deltaproteobacteria bacterium]